MIEITRSTDRIKISGHAGYAEPGKDIVCAGVSTLAQTLIASVEDLTEDTIEYVVDEQSATIDIKFWNLSDRTKCLIDSFFIGVGMIADEYRNHVKVIEEREVK